jgi:dienelactone hydrolase
MRRIPRTRPEKTLVFPGKKNRESTMVQPSNCRLYVIGTVALFLTLISGVTAAAETLRVLEGDGCAEWLEAEPSRMLNAWLGQRVDEALDRRLARLEPLFQKADVVSYQREMREVFLQALGGFPERTPLDARVTGVLDRDGYRIEKILYYSQPGFPVTATLYLPEGPGPHPGVLHSCGHSNEGKAAELYQRASALMAVHGLAVLCVDPLGQGERKQLESHGVTGATTEHMLMGVAPILLGENLATYMIWDGIRGLDYLAERPEIDAERLGCVGNSGGGMMTSYLMALDDRVRAAAPACFITDTRRKNVHPGPGDAEQNLHAQTARGLDHADFLLMRAPRPTLILAATRDYVPIDGAWEAFRQAKRLYTRLGFPEGVDLVEVNEPHGFSHGLRVAAVRWMARWLLDRDEPLGEPELERLPSEALYAAPGGSVLNLEGARSFFDLTAAKEAALAAERKRRWSDPGEHERLLAEVRELAAVPALSRLAAAESVCLGDATVGGVLWEKWVFRPEPGIVLPALVAQPPSDLRGVVLWVDGQGKDTVLGATEQVDGWLREGLAVCAVDLRGYGETATKPWRYRAVTETMGPNSAETFIAYMLGRSLVGLRATDLLQTALAWRARLPDQAPIHLVGRGPAKVPALHAAALERDFFASSDFSGGPESWSALCRGPALDGWNLENAVHGALRRYDLPDLRRTLRP